MANQQFDKGIIFRCKHISFWRRPPLPISAIFDVLYIVDLDLPTTDYSIFTFHSKESIIYLFRKILTVHRPCLPKQYTNRRKNCALASISILIGFLRAHVRVLSLSLSLRVSIAVGVYEVWMGKKFDMWSVDCRIERTKRKQNSEKRTNGPLCFSKRDYFCLKLFLFFSIHLQLKLRKKKNDPNALGFAAQQ